MLILIANIIFYATVLLLIYYLFTFAINFLGWKFVKVDVTALLVNNQHGIQRRGHDFDKKFVFKGLHIKEIDRRIF